MVTFNREFRVIEPDETKLDAEHQEWSDEFDSTQHIRDLAFWSGLSLAIGIFIGMAITAYWRLP